MATWVLLTLLVAALAPAPAAATLATMADYRIRGYMRFNRLLTGGTQCTNNFITACGAQGPWLLRAAPAALKIEGPASAVAPFNGTLIGCPEAILDVSSDSSGKNYQGDGSFRADSVSPKLVPATAILLLPGGNPNTLQMRTLTSQCIYEFTLTQATSYIMGVEPVEWISWLSAAQGRGASPALALASGLAAAVLGHALR